jgi:hypothetical protein
MFNVKHLIKTNTGSYSENGDYFSLTDIANYRYPDSSLDILKNWMTLGSTIEFLGAWERLKNPEFELAALDRLKNECGLNYFVLSPKKWVHETNAIGIKCSFGRSDVFAHRDIAFEFASWISPEFKLYIIQDYQLGKHIEICDAEDILKIMKSEKIKYII